MSYSRYAIQRSCAMTVQTILVLMALGALVGGFAATRPTTEGAQRSRRPSTCAEAPLAAPSSGRAASPCVRLRSPTDSLRPRVRTVVDLAQPSAVDVRVDLRRRERAVAEELLHR